MAELPLIMNLIDFLHRPHHWGWGGNGFVDCTTSAGEWVIAATGKDPIADLRGTYAAAEEANAIIAAAGGIEDFVGSRLEPLGFHRTVEPRDGDIGIVRAFTGFDAGAVIVKAIPGIRFRPLWAVMSARGPMVKKLEFTGAAWRIL
jgi:hypothetical protein